MTGPGVIDVEAVRLELSARVGADHVELLSRGPAVVRVDPGSAGELAEVVRIAGARGLVVVAAGSGSRPAVASTRPRILLGTRRLDQILQIDEVSLIVHAQAGVTGVMLEQALAVRGLSIGDYPPAVLASTLGGIVAVRTPGKSSARHGFFEDAVLGVSAVLADGRSVHTRVAPRRASGPDLARALCGSEGTIGLITSLVLRVHRRPETRLLAAYALPSLEHAVSAVYLALREEATPAGLRLYDAHEASAHFGGALVADGEALLVACTAGPTDLAAADRNLLASAVSAEGGHELGSEPAERWWARMHGGEVTPGPAPTLQVMATPSRLRPVYRQVLAAGARLGARVRAHVSRFDADGAVAFFTAELGRDGAGAAGSADEVCEAMRQAAEAAGGWLLGARATRFDAYLEAVRRELDPGGVMNPDALVTRSATALEPGA